MENIGKSHIESDDSDDSIDEESEKSSEQKDAKARDVATVVSRAVRERAANASERHNVPRILGRILKPESTANEAASTANNEAASQAKAKSESEEGDSGHEDTTESTEPLQDTVEAPQGEYDGELNELAPDETIYIADELVAAHRRELADKPSSGDPAEVAADTVQAKLLEGIHDGLQAEDAVPEQVVETTRTQVAEQVEQSLQIEQPLEVETEPIVTEPITFEAQSSDAESSEGQEGDPVIVATPAGGNAAEQVPVDPADPNTPTPVVAAGSGQLPPRNPNATYVYAAGGPNPPNFSPNMPTSVNYNTAPKTPDAIAVEDAEYQARRAESRGLLVGGLLGYLIGRRRGRIKTERRLVPIQKRLEEKVKTLDYRLTGAEEQVRSLTTEKYRTAGEAQRRDLLERMRAAERPPLTVEQQQQVSIAEREEPKIQLQAAEQALQQSVIMSAEKVLQSQRTAELTSDPQATAEAIKVDAPSRPTAEKIIAQSLPISEQVVHMKSHELVEAAEKVVIEGASLRTIYESRQITEPGLRHVLSEYLRGGDVQKALTQELTIKEMTFERDPQSRDRIAAALAATVNGASAKPGDDRQQDSVAPPEQTSQNNASKNTLSSKPTTGQNPISKSSNQMQDMLVRTWIVVVIFLVIIAVVLLIR